jgi:hypothetical protein
MIFIVAGKPTDGTRMSSYTQAVVVNAESKEEVIELIEESGIELNGETQEWTFEEHHPNDRGIVFESITRDY